MFAKQITRTTQTLFEHSKLNSMNKLYYAFASQKFSEKLKVNNRRKIDLNIPAGSSAQEVITNTGLNTFVNRVYKTSGLGIMGALAASQVAISSGLPFFSPFGCMIGGLIGGIGGMFGVMKMQPTRLQEQIKGSTHLRTENTPLRVGMFGLSMAGLGLSASPLFAMVSMQNPAILPTSIVISSALFGSASLYAYSRPSNSLLSWGSALYSSLFGLIGLQLVGGLTHLIIGPNMFSMCLHRVDTFVGVGIFSAMVAYDTHCAIKSYQDGDADHLMISLDFALDFWNILVRMTQILSMFSGND